MNKDVTKGVFLYGHVFRPNHLFGISCIFEDLLLIPKRPFKRPFFCLRVALEVQLAVHVSAKPQIRSKLNVPLCCNFTFVAFKKKMVLSQLCLICLGLGTGACFGVSMEKQVDFLRKIDGNVHRSPKKYPLV